MSNKLKLSVSPHIHSGQSTAGIMRDVLISLLPATIAGTVIFGLRSLLVVVVCIAACVGFEALFNFITKKDQTIGDFSAAVTGLLLALNLPANIPLWQCVIGALFAIVVVKCLFGGIGCNPVNPAITARVFMLIAFGSMTVQAFPTVVDTVSSATPLSLGEGAKMPSLLDLFLGLNGGAIGETCVLALVLGFVYLLVRRVITWHVPVAYIGTVFVCSFFMEGMDFTSALAMILS
ncbi:MAG: RnfABCDGE type electron transport complex subunit D, partial [Lachnospiraceae bacterium]|nr:RnfABCDGE type electron transport complex subunit D [Lachnospiraceae bacterium]